jgi:hypothetical protein
VKARRVKGLKPGRPADESLRRIVAVRLDELQSFVPRALEPDAGEAQHDMRIAAKRLRYVLELSAPVFGPPATKAAKALRRLQDKLGEIHDCDELIAHAERELDRLRAEDAAALRALAGRSADLDPIAAREAPNRAAYRGLQVLIAYLTARRAVLVGGFVRYWDRLEHQAFAETLLAGHEPPRPEVSAAEPAPGDAPDAGAR